MANPVEPVYNDTLFYDVNEIATWQSDSNYDYNRELMTREVDVIRLIGDWISELLQKVFGSRVAGDYIEIVLIALFVALLLIVVWFLYRKRPELFMRSRKKLPYHISEDTIYGVNFSKEIDDALSRKDFREAVRLLYLQTLKQLSDAGQIDWQLYKTPTEYIYELKKRVNGNTFRDLTNRFLRVRYGNFEATEQLFNEIQRLQRELAEVIASSSVKHTTEGGEP